jgi:hypothetical protein
MRFRPKKPVFSFERGDEILIFSGPNFRARRAWFVEEADNHVVISYNPLSEDRYTGKSYFVISKGRVSGRCAA